VKQSKVRLYIRIRSANGKDTYANPAWNKNHTLREGYAVVNGKSEHHPEWSYYLRHARDGKRVWSSVGKCAALALVALRNREHDLQAMKLGRVESSAKDTENHPASPTSSASLSVSEATAEYLNQIRSSRAAKTIAACEDMLGHFCAAVGTKIVSRITRNDPWNTWPSHNSIGPFILMPCQTVCRAERGVIVQMASACLELAFCCPLSGSPRSISRI